MSINIKSMINPETMTINRDALVLIINEFRKVDVAPLSTEEFNKKALDRLGRKKVVSFTKIVEAFGEFSRNIELPQNEACIMAECFGANLRNDILIAFSEKKVDVMQRDFLNRSKNVKTFRLTINLIKDRCLGLQKSIEDQELIVASCELFAPSAKASIEASEEEIRELKEDARALYQFSSF